MTKEQARILLHVVAPLINERRNKNARVAEVFGVSKDSMPINIRSEFDDRAAEIDALETLHAELAKKSGVPVG